jgi:hypothetical protein
VSRYIFCVSHLLDRHAQVYFYNVVQYVPFAFSPKVIRQPLPVILRPSQTVAVLAMDTAHFKSPLHKNGTLVRQPSPDASRPVRL